MGSDPKLNYIHVGIDMHMLKQHMNMILLIYEYTSIMNIVIALIVQYTGGYNTSLERTCFKVPNVGFSYRQLFCHTLCQIFP